MKTERLYFDNPYMKEFKANIIEILPYKDKQAVILDRTAFYPEGGGQPADTGHLNNIPVLDAIEENGEILHIVESAPDSKEVTGLINWERRFDHMQQHTGQHILSACFDKLMNGGTDSFHLGKDIVSIEIGIDSFTETDASRVEKLANDIIYSNIPVSARIVNDDELQSIPLRKKPKVTENIRIVEVQEFDYSPCGGTHVNRTGEIGMIKIKSWERLKGCYRIEFICGYRALKDYNLQNSITQSLGGKLSVRDFDIVEAFNRMHSDYKSVQKQLQAAQQELMKYEADELLGESRQVGKVKVVSVVLEGRSINDAKVLSQYITRNPGYASLMVCKNDTAQVIFARSEDVELDMNSLLKSIFPIIDGKGGGNSKTAQGGGSNLEGINEFLDAALERIEKGF